MLEMSLISALTNIIHGKLDFCCLCFGQPGENLVYIDDEVFVESNTSITMADIINTIFGDTFISSSLGVFCNPCSVSAVNSYNFITMCKRNSKNLISAVQSIQESLENTLPDLESYNTLYVAVDMDNFTSKQFYDDGIMSRPLKAFKRFLNIINTTVEQKLTKTDIHVKQINTSKRVKRKHKIRNENSKKRTENTLLLDIPSFHTKNMLAKEDDLTNFQCKNCMKIFTMEEKLRWHFFKKHYPKNVKCSKCPQSFISKEMLHAHELNVHTVGVCKVCGKYFTSKNLLKKHEFNHDFQITCTKCGRMYRSMEAFRKHISDNVCQQKMKKSADQAVYECDHCQKRYCYKPYLSKHIMYEHGNKEGFRCEFCNKNFYTQSRLKTHLVKHTKEKNYVCETCNKRFVTRESLLYHTRLHTGEKPYSCDYCNQSFLNASRRLSHVRKHHLPPSLECTICHAKFNCSATLLKHKRSHSNPVEPTSHLVPTFLHKNYTQK